MAQDDLQDPMLNQANKGKLGLGDFPSLRDLETSNATKSNLDIAGSTAQLARQILEDKTRKAYYDKICKEIKSNASKRSGHPAVTFSDLTKGQNRASACSKFMELMVFQKAGLINLKQESLNKNRDFANITIFKRDDKIEAALRKN